MSHVINKFIKFKEACYDSGLGHGIRTHYQEKPTKSVHYIVKINDLNGDKNNYLWLLPQMHA